MTGFQGRSARWGKLTLAACFLVSLVFGVSAFLRWPPGGGRWLSGSRVKEWRNPAPTEAHQPIESDFHFRGQDSNQTIGCLEYAASATFLWLGPIILWLSTGKPGIGAVVRDCVREGTTPVAFVCVFSMLCASFMTLMALGAVIAVFHSL
jgi:hypothetical protein